MPNVPLISIIIPTYNEAKGIKACLQQFNAPNLGAFEVIVSDASGDDTAKIVEATQKAISYPLRLVRSRPGRAVQMNAGARMAQGENLLFLHADTRLPKGGLERVRESLLGHKAWGGFAIKFCPETALLKWIARRANLRLRFFKTVYGDQTLFIKRALFGSIGGFPLGFMEDLEISKRLKRMGYGARFVSISTPVVTSSRRFIEGGVLRIYLKMMCGLLMYWAGVNKKTIQGFYEKRS